MRTRNHGGSHCICPDLFLELLRSRHFRPSCLGIRHLAIRLQPRVEVLSERVLKRELLLPGQQLQSQICSLCGVDSWAINPPLSLNREVAPVKVSAISKPNTANSAVSIVPRLLRSLSDSRRRRAMPRRRPVSSMSSMPRNSSSVKTISTASDLAEERRQFAGNEDRPR